MNKSKLISLLCLVCIVISCFAACGDAGVGSTKDPAATGGAPSIEHVDYASKVNLDLSSNTAKQEVTVKSFIDGDTVHFNVPNSLVGTSVLKARFLAVNTPESTGKIEVWGKKASNFTKEALSKATSIYIESDDTNWNADSTGGRYLVWIWYKTAESDTYRNLNIELLQNGLAIASSSANNRYGSTCMAALDQAKAEKLHVHSTDVDPDYYYGEAVELTLKELRTNINTYSGKIVAFNGVVTMNSNQTVYVETYDAETDMYYGISVYYGYNLSGAGLDILTVGNEVRIVGSVQYYEAGGTWQISDLEYRQMKPKDPRNIQKLSEGNAPAFRLTTPADFNTKKLDIEVDGKVVSFDYAQLAMSTSVEMKNLKVVKTYTTTNDESSSKGAMTLTCEIDGQTIDVRTVVLLDEKGNLITESAYAGKTINVKGIVDYYMGAYQIKVFTAKDITIVE